jgi:hypothetical protein
VLKKLILFPFLFILYVIGGLVTSNLGQLDPSQAFVPLFILLVVTGLMIGIIQIIVHDWHYAGYLGFISMAFFLIYGHLNRALGSWIGGVPRNVRLILLVIWWFFMMGIGWKGIWRRLGSHRVTYALNLFFLCAVLIQGIASIPGWMREYNLFSGQRGNAYLLNEEKEPDIQCQNTPDIYYIIADGHARVDVLQELYETDATPFYSYLESKGFFIADQSHANYTQTAYSLSASLNFSYLGLANSGTGRIEYFKSLFSENRLMQWLKNCGYRIYTTQSGYSYSKFFPKNSDETHVAPLNDFTSLLLLGSPLDVFARFGAAPALKDPYQSQCDLIHSEIEETRAISTSTGPKIVLMHIMAPHPPFVFDATGQPIRADRDYTALDGTAFPGSIEEYRTGYAEQVTYIDKLLIQTVETLLENSSSPPVIILQGDHGPGSSFDWDSVERSCLWERSAILNAYYLPGVDKSKLDPEISPVNTFRLILNEYFDADLDLLDDRSYYVYYQSLNQRVDITDTRDTKDNCSIS